MDSAVVKRVVKGLGANGYGQLVSVVVQLVGVPVLLYAWGPQLYGEWLILFAIPTYLSIADLGFSQSVANDMTARVARGDRAGALAAFQTLAVLVCGIVAVGLLFSAVILWRLPLDRFLNFEVMLGDEARWVLWFLIAKVLVRLLDGVNNAGFRAAGEYAFHQGLFDTARLVQFAAIWVVALIGGGPVPAAGASLAASAVTTVGIAVLLTRRHVWLRFGAAHAKRAELRRLAKPALANASIPLAQALNLQGMIIVVGAVLGPPSVVVLSTLRTLTRMAVQAVLSVARSIEPELASAYGAGNLALMRTLFVHGLRASAWLGLATALSLMLFGPYIIEVWTADQVTLDSTLFIWLIASALASVLWFVALAVLKAVNKHIGAALLYMLSSGGAVGVAAFLLIQTGNLAAVGVALLGVDAVMILYALSKAGRLLQLRPLASVGLAANPVPLFKAFKS